MTFDLLSVIIFETDLGVFSMIFAVIAIVITIIVIAIIIGKKTYSPESKGERGENRVAKILGDTISCEQYVINDLLFQNENGQSCQIDHIFINKFGIWVIETKNYTGNIYGQENQREWTQVLAYGNEKNKFYNPIKQNATHIYHLSNYLKVKNVFINVVVFLSHADITNIVSNNVYSIYELPKIKNQTTNITLSIDKMEYYYNKLLELKNNATITKNEHIENIYKMQQQIQRGICPRCGGKLVLHNGKYGQFYGCSNFPNCKFKKRIE